MQEALQSGANVEAYREGALESLDDAFHVLELGLKELSSFLSGQDRRPLRLGRLLLEKGEQEYMAVLELLQNQTLGSERERTLDLWGQLSFEASRFCKGEIASQEWAEILSWGEWAMGAHMDGTFRDFQRAVGLLRSQPELPQEAQKKVLASLNRLKEFLGLSVGDGEAYAASLLTSKLKPDVLDKLTHFVDQGPTL